ncbi:MAG: peptide chain release factor 3 [Bacteroidetes bacterium]|jgi:peptide chain release factor 3|nr:peptide chain release factor 3 [Bacteroidota bacterium]
MDLQAEINKRKTFAIISHPDAGKTTLTEKFLLFGGAILTAGAVKSNKIKKTATSDFMEIEKQRGISVATSVMGFEYKGRKINILDTPGHKDFAEDTYRTLTAVDSVILVIDCVKGVEEQTEKLMGVCRMRNIPVIIFINKMDREGKDPFDLLDEVEAKLNIKVHPLSWPISQGQTFQGVYNLYHKSLNLFTSNKTKLSDDIFSVADLNDPILAQKLKEEYLNKLKEDVELVDGVYSRFDVKNYLDGSTAPVFFGSAINNFGIQELLDTFIEFAPPPIDREATERMVQATEPKFSGFVFKIHANLDPNHRDRIAFLRICSGRFERNKFYQHTRLNKQLRFTSPTSFMANEKNIIEEAYPGDVIGLYDSGNFKIGDTITEGETLHFRGIPSFSPEIFKELVNKDPLKSKQLDKGINQLTDEGVAQLFTQQPGNRKIVGTVGDLQFEVLQFRLQHEYGASCEFRMAPFTKACWVTCDDPAKLATFLEQKERSIAYDKDGDPVFLADSDWALNMAMEYFGDIKFHFTSEHKTATEQTA